MSSRCHKAIPGNLSNKTRIFIGIIMLLSLPLSAFITYNFIMIRYDWINVHLIPHTHDDVGWLRTPEDYYRNYVRYILKRVVTELKADPDRRFVYAETYYFWYWWQEQDDNIKALVSSLIKKKQLEIVGGGWCMSDEAVTHYQSFIDQSTWGFRLLNDTFGPMARPTVGWQIDTFGHSKGIASLLGQMGFNSLFFARIDYNDRKYRKIRKQMEFVWTGNKNLGDRGSIFTSIFYDHYSAPKGFDFEVQNTEVDMDYAGFANLMRTQAKAYKTENILVPMGDDFRYFNARKYFIKIDKLIKFFKENPDFKLNVFYSTPSDYINTLENENLAWPVKQGDFFPYASEELAYWTGFFTSRPTLKYFERISNNMLQIAKQLLVLSQTGMKYFRELTTLREAVGVLQHHDAITGTSQQHVTDHYSKLLYEGIRNCVLPIDESLRILSLSNSRIQTPTYRSCLLLNISVCEVSEVAQNFIVTVYNPLSRRINHYVRIPVPWQCYTVLTSKGQMLATQLLIIPESVKKIPGRKSSATAELLFRATNIPPLGFKSFFVTKTLTCKRRRYKRNFFKNKVKPMFSRSNKLLNGVKTKRGNFTISQHIRYYLSDSQLSGAYLFKPKEDTSKKFPDSPELKLLNNGALVREYEQTFSSWASQIIRTYSEEDYIEFEWLIGPIPVDDNIGKEVILVYNSTIKNGRIFYTDVNGMEMEKRIKDFQSWTNKICENVASNYYPVTTMISIKDDADQIFIVVDRPQGGTSLQNGEIQLMVHRRLCNDDGKGVDEPLNETAYGTGLVARGRHWLLFGGKEVQVDQAAKLLAQSKHSEPWLFFLDASEISFENWRENFITEFSGLYSYVPRNIRILTLEPWRENEVLLRLEHIFEKLPALRLANAPEDINLKDLFKNFDVLEARETTLGADRWLSEAKRTKWRKHVYNLRENKEKAHLVADDLTVSLRPQEIRTFIVTIKVKN